MSQPMNWYKADLRDFRFLMFEQFGLEALLGQERYADWDVDNVNLVIDEAYRFACEVTGPLNGVGDRQGCRLEEGRVKAPEGFKAAWDQLYEAGWKGIGSPESRGGQGAPLPLQAAVEEMLSGSNTSFAMYPGLAHAAADVIAEFGTPAQIARFAKPMFEGRFGGTMCLTEPHAGSDVGAASSTATPNGDGTYSIKGTKIFISGGDHDLAENIVHLVLARIDGARSGTKGLSLFIVPRLRVDAGGASGEGNDVQVPSIEHKMGLNGSATCVVQFGDEASCVGELVGTVEHRGMAQMFMMMNTARIGVGIQGLSIAGAAYLNALAYARERKQGAHIAAMKDPDAPRVAILEHADIRRLLLDMKSKVEGTRALAMKLSHHMDVASAMKGNDEEGYDYHYGQVELLTPLLKSYGSDLGFRVSEHAIQIHGGAGFTQDYSVEQYCRDSKIFSIYEGTNHIQALDLVGRKLSQRGGKNAQAFLADVQSFVSQHKDHPALAAAVGRLDSAQQAVAATAMKFVMWSQGGQLEQVPLVANRFLEMLTYLTLGWLLLDQAVIALKRLEDLPEKHPDRDFYEGKRHAARFFAESCLPEVVSSAAVIGAGDRSALDISDASFARL